MKRLLFYSPKAELDEDKILGKVTFEHVAFSYDKSLPLITDLSLTIPTTSKIAIVGPTGAGKSTLINLLMRFYEVDKGQILLDGVPTSSIDILLKNYGNKSVWFCKTWLKTGTIHENIAYGNPDASRRSYSSLPRGANADFFIRQLPNGYDTFLADAGSSLSQGQRQLLTIARIFVKVLKS